MSEVNKYNNSKIYKIWSPSRDDLVYYGSTYQSLSQRMSIHRSNYRRWKEGKYHNVSSFKIFEECDDYRIELVENYPCSNKEELNAREGYYIRNNTCVNKVVPDRTKKEYRIDNKEKIKEQSKQYRENHKEEIKQYYQDNKEELKDQSKQYYEANKEKIDEKHKKYYQEHKEQKKQYREANKDEINEKHKQYHAANREKINARRRELRKLKKENPQ